MHNILYLCPSENMFGAEQSLYQLLKRLNRDKYAIFIAAPGDSKAARFFLEHGFRVVDADIVIPPRPGNIFRAVKTTLRLMHLVRKNRISLVHFNLIAYPESLLFFVLFLRLAGIPMVFHHRTHYPQKALQRLIMFRGTVICVCHATRQDFLVKRRSDPLTRPRSKDVITLYDSRELERFKGISPDELAKLKKDFRLENQAVVGIIAAIDKFKRQDRFLYAARLVKEKFNQVKFMIIGDTYYGVPEELAYKQKVVELTQELRLSEDVIFTGFRGDVDKLIHLLDLVVLTSDKDVFPGVIIEAMAAKKCVVAPAIYGIPEIIEDNKTGFLIDSPDPACYAEKILELLKDPARRAEMGEAGYLRARRLFDIDKHVSEVEALYRKLLLK
ncbi:MAG: glycosyltransferase family 4 protein [Candidatus Omnitrophica bacterium]|nr:glycosyltransferase family 4 protein [Candidatus Omnitrophota bacterium]MDD5512309.1 glycosyltransferase family 4 protein [Candidatus Omnitrophota bacterium]